MKYPRLQEIKDRIINHIEETNGKQERVKPWPTPAPPPIRKTATEWANHVGLPRTSGFSDPESGAFVSTFFNERQKLFYNELSKIREEKMIHEEIVIKITNNGFFVSVGCQDFVFATEKELFQAISDYNKDPEKAREKYCRKGE